jgi:hypothetical protein
MNPCPQCGAPLRWIPEGNFWNCDRCGNRVAPNPAPATPQPATYQQSGGHPHDQSGLHPHDQSGLHPPQQQGYPPQQHGYPPQGYPPQGYGHYPHPGAPKGKGKLIAIIVVVAALAAGGIVLAVVLSKKSSGGGGGAESSEALAKTFIEALAAGDGAKVVALSAPVDLLVEYSDCPPEKLEENKKQYAQSLDKAKTDAASFKDHGLVFKSVKSVGEKKEFKAGDAMGECKAKKAYAMQPFTVDVEFDAPDKTKKASGIGMPALILDGKYFLGPGAVDPELFASAMNSAINGTPTTPDTPTPTPTPAAAGDPAALKAEMDALKTASCACTDKTCADAQWAKLMAFVETNKATLEAPGAEALNAAGSESVKCLDKLRMGSPTPTEPTPIPTTPTTPTTPTEPGKGLPECEAYAKAAERFIKCSKVPKQSRDAVQTAVDTMRKNWGDPATMSEDMRKSAAETCVTLEKSMKDAAKAIGCK